MQIFIPKSAAFIVDTLVKAGFEAYIVGGCVRDSLLGLVPDDFDVCTSAKPEETVALFEKTVNTGIKHGTVTVISYGVPVEVTTFRLESGYNDFRRPQSVEFVNNLKDDLSRRDFTINAMCYSDKTGIIDYFGGLDDLKNGIIRTVGDPDLRFCEDALRILRLFRFCSTTGFKAEDITLKSAIKNAYLLKNISAQRIAKELKRTASGKNPSAILPLLEKGVFKTLNPDKRIDKIKNLPKGEDLRFFAFLQITSSDLTKTLKLLKCSNAFSEYALKLNCALNKTIETRADVKRALNLLENDIFDLFCYKTAIMGKDTKEQKAIAEEILNGGEPYKISQLAVNGFDIKKSGYKGNQIGDILKKLLNAVIENPELNTKEQLEKLFK